MKTSKYLIAQMFSACLFAWGLWIAVTGRARFDVGGSEHGTSRPVRIDAEGLDAIVIGIFIMGIGLLGVVQYMTGKRALRLPLAYLALTMVGGSLLYGGALAARALWRLGAEIAS